MSGLEASEQPTSVGGGTFILRSESMRGLESLEKDDRDDAPLNPWAILGGVREENAFYMKSLALSNPQKYEALRASEMKKVGEAVKASYTASFESYQRAGYSKEENQHLSMQAAAMSKQVQMNAFHSRFPTANEAVYSSANARDGGLVATALPGRPKSAPRKKAKAGSRKRK
jgi:hypothetical protein